MRLSFHEKYLSIDRFNDVDLPEITVLTGKNGTGKSHLLKAIKNGSVLVDGKTKISSPIFDFSSFKVPAESANTTEAAGKFRQSAWALFCKDQKGYTVQSLIGKLANSGGEHLQFVKEYCTRKRKGLFEVSLGEVAQDYPDPKVGQALEKFRTGIENIFLRRPELKPADYMPIFSLQRRHWLPISELSEEEFKDLITPYTVTNEVIAGKFSSIFVDYLSKHQANDFAAYLNEKRGQRNVIYSDTEFALKYGEKPWEAVNRILEMFDSVNVRITYPNFLNPGESFVARLIHVDRPGVECNFHELSSGEQTVLALVATVYRTILDKSMPDLIMLDEIDSALHPSIIRNLFYVVSEVLVKGGANVILVTHSPTTTALAPEGSVFLMESAGADRIRRVDRGRAIEMLSEGMVTLESGLRIFDEITDADVNVLTEGRNARYIRKALDLHGISNVAVVTAFESHSGKSQLKTLFEFMKAVPNKRSFLFVWDCDASFTLSEGNNVYPFIFESNPLNTVCSSGIENLFEDYLFADLCVAKTPPGEKTQFYFDMRKKVDLETRIIAKSDASDFQRFVPLFLEIDRIRDIRGRSQI